jgi:predicted nucleic acid-binding protein
VYVDTSVVVKLFTREPDSQACESIVGDAPLVSSELLYCEFNSALLAKERTRVISPEVRAAVWEAFELSLTDRRIKLVPLSGSVVRIASEILTAVHPGVALRTLDALHLATFRGIQSGPLFTKDKRMRQASRQLNFTLAD